jgi:hypothetical protein
MFVNCVTSAALSCSGDLSEEKSVLSFVSHSIYSVSVCTWIFTIYMFDMFLYIHHIQGLCRSRFAPNLESHFPYLYPRRNRGTQLYPRLQGFYCLREGEIWVVVGDNTLGGRSRYFVRVFQLERGPHSKLTSSSLLPWQCYSM